MLNITWKEAKHHVYQEEKQELFEWLINIYVFMVIFISRREKIHGWMQ